MEWINTTDDEITYDPTRLTLKVGDDVLCDMGLQMFYNHQEFTCEASRIELEDWDVVISVTKTRKDSERTEIENERLVHNIVMAIQACMARDGTR